MNRRSFLADSFRGFSGLALAAMLHKDGYAASGDGKWAPPDGKPHFKPKAKSVIWLFMNGGVSHMETFDPKPMLTKFAGKTIAETPFKDTNGQQRNRLLPLQIRFKKRGKCGMDVSDWLPHLGDCVDDIAVVRSMYTTDDNHGAQTQFHSGRHMLDGEFPTLGAWVHYGLGTLNDNLPQFISMGNREYWNNKDGFYLGPEHDAIPMRVDLANPLDYGKPDGGLGAAEQKVGFDLVGRLNRLRA